MILKSSNLQIITNNNYFMNLQPSNKNEKFRIQPQYKKVILICLVFIGCGIYSLRNLSLYMIIWIFFVAAIGFVYLLYKRIVLLYEDYFTVSNNFRKNKRNNELPYSCIKEISYHISSGRGGNILSIKYTDKIKVIKINYELFGNDPIEILKFLHFKNVPLKIEDSNVFKSVFGHLPDLFV